VFSGEDGHLYLAHGDGRKTERLTWASEDFAPIPGLPPMPGVTGELEDAHVFAHPTPSRDGTRVAAFGLLPTLQEEETESEGAPPWEQVEEQFPYLGPARSGGEDEHPSDDVAAGGMLLPGSGEGELGAEPAATDEAVGPGAVPRGLVPEPPRPPAVGGLQDGDDELADEIPEGLDDDDMKLVENTALPAEDLDAARAAGADAATGEADADDRGDDEDEEDEELPTYWPGGHVYVVHTDGVRVWEAWQFEGGSPTHLEWAPDDRHLMVLHQDQGVLHLHLVDGEHPRAPRLVTSGAPIFWAWQPGGSRLLTRVMTPGAGPAKVLLSDPFQPGEPLEIGEAGQFYVPDWHPDGLSFVFAEAGARDDRIVRSDLHGRTRQTLYSFPGRAAFRWGPSGRDLAVAVAPEGHGAFEILEIVDAVDRETRGLWEGPFIAFQWLPDGSGVLLCHADRDTGRLRWARHGLDGSRLHLGPAFAPSRETVVSLHFFEQVAHSHPFLSADGDFLVYCGHPDEDESETTSGAALPAVPASLPDDDDGEFGEGEDAGPPPRILVTPVSGLGPTVAVGTGRFGCFAGRRAD
jgi:hypothetical protein